MAGGCSVRRPKEWDEPNETAELIPLRLVARSPSGPLPPHAAALVAATTLAPSSHVDSGIHIKGPGRVGPKKRTQETEGPSQGA